ncbi:MAG: hypothetical protein ABIH20_01030 [Candidatus Diapherotrites archaeon]
MKNSLIFFIVLALIVLSGCTNTNELIPINSNPDSENQVISSVVIKPEDKLILVTGEEIIYKGNVNIPSGSVTEWKATFFISNDSAQRFDLGSGESKTIGVTKILVKEILTYQTGAVEIELIEG